MAKERKARGPGDTNTQIITTDGGRISRPQNLLNGRYPFLWRLYATATASRE